MTLLGAWNGTGAGERAVLITAICKEQPSLVCSILRAQGYCNAGVLRDYIYGNKNDTLVSDFTPKQ